MFEAAKSIIVLFLMNVSGFLYLGVLTLLFVGCRQDETPDLKEFQRVFDVRQSQQFRCNDGTTFAAQFGEQNRSVAIQIGEDSTRLPLMSTATGGEYSDEETSVWFNRIGDAVLDAEGVTMGETACERQGFEPMTSNPE